MLAERKQSFSLEEKIPPSHSREYIVSLVKDTEDEVFLMKDTGFETARQTEMYFRLKNENPNLTNFEINQLFASRTDSDIRAYEREFLARQPVLVNHLSSNIVDQELHIIGTKYSQRLLNVISGNERHGAIKSAIAELEKRLLFAPPNSLFAIHSPSGWAKDGYDDLPDDQIYLYKLDKDRNLSAITLRLSLSLDEHEAVLNTNPAGDYKDQLIQTSSTIIQKSNYSFEDYLNLIEENLGREIAWVDTDKNRKIIDIHTFADIKEKLANLPELLIADEKVDTIAQGLYWHLRADIDFAKPENTKLLVRALGKAALDMQDLIERKQGKVGQKNYHQLANRAKELKGCVATANRPQTVSELRKMGYTEKSCKNCGKVALCGPCTKMCTECEKIFGIF